MRFDLLDYEDLGCNVIPRRDLGQQSQDEPASGDVGAKVLILIVWRVTTRWSARVSLGRNLRLIDFGITQFWAREEEKKKVEISTVT